MLRSQEFADEESDFPDEIDNIKPRSCIDGFGNCHTDIGQVILPIKTLRSASQTNQTDKKKD